MKRYKGIINRHYVVVPALAQLQKKILNKGLAFTSFQNKHHHICTLYVHQQEIRILKLLDVLKSHRLGLENKQYHHIKNFVTGEVFPQEASQQIVGCDCKLIVLLQVFVLTAKKLQLNCIKKHLGETAVKLTDRIVQLRDNANV